MFQAKVAADLSLDTLAPDADQSKEPAQFEALTMEQLNMVGGGEAGINIH